MVTISDPESPDTRNEPGVTETWFVNVMLNFFPELQPRWYWIDTVRFRSRTVPVVKQNLTLVILAIVLLSISPAIVEYLRYRGKRGLETRD